jgi:hypothetical protein
MLHVSSYIDTLSKSFRIVRTYCPTKTRELSNIFYTGGFVTLCFGNRRIFRNLKFILFIFVNKNTHLAWRRDISNASALLRPMYPRVLWVTALTTRDIWMAPCIFSLGLHRRCLHYYTTLFLQWCQMFLLSWNTSHQL